MFIHLDLRLDTYIDKSVETLNMSGLTLILLHTLYDVLYDGHCLTSLDAKKK